MESTLTKQEKRQAARDARRAAQRAATLRPVEVIEPKPRNLVTAVIGAAGTAVWIALAGWSYTAATVDDMIGGAVLPALAFIVAVAALMASERYGGFASRRRLVLNLTFAGVMAAASSLLFWWEFSHRPSPATADEISKKVLEGIRPQSAQTDGVPQKLLPVPSPPRGGVGFRDAPGGIGNKFIGNISEGYETGFDLQGSNEEICKNLASKNPLPRAEVEAILRSHPECTTPSRRKLDP
jgi:hypothetical protein